MMKVKTEEQLVELVEKLTETSRKQQEKIDVLVEALTVIHDYKFTTHLSVSDEGCAVLDRATQLVDKEKENSHVE